MKYLIYHMKDLKSEHYILLSERTWLPLKKSHALGSQLRTFSTKINMLTIKA